MYAQHTSGQSGSTRGGAPLVFGAVSEIVETVPRLPVTNLHSELVIRLHECSTQRGCPAVEVGCGTRQPSFLLSVSPGEGFSSSA